MKKIIAALFISFSLLSCSISEEVFFNADGSGKLAYTINMSKMMELTKELDKKNTKKMSKGLMDDTEKDVDSVIAFKDIPAKFKKEGKELTPEQIANIEKMKDCSMRIVVNNAKSEFKYILTSDFKNVNDIGNVGSMVSAMQTASGKNTDALGATANDSEVKYTYDGKKFTRTVIEKPVVEELEEVYEEEVYEEDHSGEDVIEELKDTTIVNDGADDIEYEEAVSEDEEISEEEIKKMNEEFKKMGELMEKGMKESAFEFKYTFTKKIKKVSLPKSQYKLSDDKKTIFMKYEIEEFTKKIKNLNFEIVFE
ncbi:hypothetical protein [Flavobacterium urocaniciphilum]|uniref:Lipoprotein n=1 Tax=Flavobacterium urocaniciphilum TaxID=1299341 RepID=A0A1H9AVM9_9FLAO|nr:hypothetical protein [Flavobacterium urocaniciphilum]SEP80800.1 hypothetical protein SAMN05444005_102364 [Flavobacterium urocaniciphilum]